LRLVAVAVTALVDADGIVQRPPSAGPWGVRAVVVDPDGRRVEPAEDVSRAGSSRP
jgi:hypothetical protein